LNELHVVEIGCGVERTATGGCLRRDIGVCVWRLWNDDRASWTWRTFMVCLYLPCNIAFELI